MQPKQFDIKVVKLACKKIICMSLLLINVKVFSQDCPQNIDFENGTFNGWTCYTGSVAAVNGENVITLFPNSGPTAGQHEMYSAATSNGELDYYGDFPVICPNGSRYSVKLGNTTGGAQAEGLSYEFTIPADRSTYSLIYHYAVVFQDPNHQPFEQPRLVLEVQNVTDNELISCSSFTFFPNGSPLPGFYISPRSDSTTVWCKNWSAVTINLNGKAGKTIRLFFKTADCTFRRHFGYAYIDVDSECSSEFVGATYCPDDTAVNVTAPFGYQNYTWFNNSFSQVLGTEQMISLSPPPPVGTTLAVELVPYDGYGCLDTLYAILIDTLKLKANAGPDVVSCNNNSVLIGANSKPGVVYSWSPVSGLSNPNIANPTANPSATTSYILSVRSTGGGCLNRDTVVVKSSIIDNTLQLKGKTNFCVDTGDSALLSVQPTATIQWFRDNLPITGANQPDYRVIKSGSYYAALLNEDGCTLNTRTEEIEIEIPRPGITYPVQYALVNSPIELQARTFGESILWKPSLYLDEPASTQPSFNAPIVTSQLYTIDIITSAGCLTVDTQTVKTIKEVKIYVPSGFTPNNDGLNDYLKPILVGIKDLQFFRIYNRWGQLVFDLKSNSRGWDGTLNGLIQQTGVFVWTIQGVGLDNKTYFQKGTTLLIR